MTEQEAEVFAARLERIWMPQGEQFCRVVGKMFIFDGTIYPDIRFICSGDPTSQEYHLGLVRSVGKSKTGHLICTQGNGQFSLFSKSGTSRTSKDFKQFAHEWMDFFRRGCWLSGCPIEATAHEKAEWIQGFSREEIEAWNLTM